MSMTFNYLAAVAMLLVVTNVSAEMVKERELIRRIQTAPSDAIVRYCRTESPETIQLVDSGYKVYLASFEKAMVIWSTEKPETQIYLDSQISSDSVEVKRAEATVTDVGMKILEAVKQHDPHEYCPWMASRLKASTPELLLKHLHEFDSRVESGSKEKQAQ